MKGYFAHESSFVDEPCTIGEGTKIWHFSHVMKDSLIGARCTIGQNVLVASGVQIGDNCKIQNNVSLYTGVILEDHVFCGPSMVFTNVINPRSEIVRRNEYRPTLVKRGASIGANATVLCGITIGSYAFIGAGAVVTHDVPDFALVVGNPAKRAGWMCRCGVKLRVDGARTRCAACGTSYTLHEDVLRFA
jgi:UDP-2-acetamido-3-amino-2,3-dideoxy-glucuronate N-acetyltransferase